MFNSGFFIRLIVAALVALVMIAIIPPFLRIVGYPASSDVLAILKLAIAALAVIYVFKG